jgi:predicted AlkP superfamily pyrophosphatase or phosphodiesterase
MVRPALPSLLIGLALALLSACASGPVSRTDARAPQGMPPLVLISIDAFRPDYLDRGLTPNLKALAEGGAEGQMQASFPSLTFPNHYTLVTGKVPDHHGVVANYMYDPTYPGATPQNRLAYFDKSKSDDGFWWKGATPVWVSAERAGLTAASVYWPGSQAEIGGVKLVLSPAWDKTSTSETRVQQILNWMDLPPAQRPKLYLLYFDQVDQDGHHHGPDSAELNRSLVEVDTAIGHLLAGMKQRGVTANVVVVSDHGMMSVSPERTTYLSDALGGLPVGARTDPRYEMIYWGALAMLNATPGHEADVDRLTHMHFDHMQCWHKADIPRRFRFGRNPRVTDVVCLAEPGWQVGGIRAVGIGTDVGNHGYDPAEPLMRAIFIANGPGIRAHIRLPTFPNTDVYDFEMKLLGLTPEANDGSLAPLKPALKQ